jgi:tetratricopeptide (TPR) repeat protein
MTMNRYFIALMLASGSTMLGGCQVFHSAFAAKPAGPKTASVDLSSYFAERLETGRRDLQANRPAQAITAFRQASYDPASAGSAFNGMAIAYSQMGRDDLARRYFTAAMQADPNDGRFARNLARLDQGVPSVVPERAFAQIDPEGAEAIAPVAAAIPETSRRTHREPAALGLTRVSPREVTLPSRESGSAARPTEIRAPARAEATATAFGRVTVDGRSLRNPRSDYPVRLALTDVPRRAAPSYPVRIELPPAK